MKEIGIGLTTHATIVRGVLLPASMKLLSENTHPNTQIQAPAASSSRGSCLI